MHTQSGAQCVSLREKQAVDVTSGEDFPAKHLPINRCHRQSEKP